MTQISTRSIEGVLICTLAFFFAERPAWSQTTPQPTTTTYLQTNLVSDIPGLAQSTDPNLKNPWGVSFGATSPFWVSDAATGLSTLYQGTGSTVNSRVVAVPGGPTGEVNNATTDFVEANGKPASFIFATLSGAIYAWNATNTNNVAQQAATVANASFTGLALANNGAGNFLYAANMAGSGSIDVFNSSFAQVNLAGSFTDPNLSSLLFGNSGIYVPYNIQSMNGQLYVEYANFQSRSGAVSIFDFNGNFIKELIPPGGPNLNEPWGIVIAPAGFGSLSGDLLVGNLGDGKINAFDPSTGAFIATLSGFNGPIVNSGLWALSVRTGGTFNTSAVYFTAGINGQNDGLFGELTAVTPTTLAITTASPLTAGTIGTAYTQTLAAVGGAPPYSNWTIMNGALPPGLTLNSTTGTISGTPVTVGGTFSFTVSVKDSSGASTSDSFQLTIQQPSSTATLTRIGSFAQTASGAGWNTTMTLINLSGATVNAQINLYADSGKPMTLPLLFPEFGSGMMASSVNLTLTPNGSVVIQTNVSTALGEGWADVQASGSLTGYSTLEVSGTGVTPAEATIDLDSRLSTSLAVPYDNTNGAQTAVALANQSPASQQITVTLFDQSGKQLSSSPVTLPGFGHMAFFLNSQFSQSANQLGVIEFQSAGGITGIGLRFDSTGAFTSIPIIR